MDNIDNKIDYQILLEKDFNKKIDLIKDKINILHFSTGADSVASFLKLRENGIEPILIYKYFIVYLFGLRLTLKNKERLQITVSLNQINSKSKDYLYRLP